MRRSQSATSSSPTLKTSSLYTNTEFSNYTDNVIGLMCTVRRPCLANATVCNTITSNEHSTKQSSNDNNNNQHNTFSGTILEVRELYRARKSLESETYVNNTSVTTTDANINKIRELQKLYAYVRRKDGDHRNGGWFPVSWIELANNSQYVIDHVHLNPIYTTITASMSQTMRSEKELDYLEERLSRDCKSPTCIRYFVYLNKFIFAPWYYAPYGLLNLDFDPLRPLIRTSSQMPLQEQQQEFSSSSLKVLSSTVYDAMEEKHHNCNEEEKHKNLNLDQHICEVAVNPYIRDAYLCPFSLRVYTSYDQILYETRTYRANKLHPPGEEIYRDDARHFSLFEINGSTSLTYCRHLFLLGKSFLENKLAGHDVHNYFFYVFCLHHCHYPEYIDDTCAMYFAGYFTWEKQVAEHNLACIVTLPCFAGCSANQTTSLSRNTTTLKGIGQFMIATSYELARRRRQVGSPEKPLSDLGSIAYGRYWQEVIVRWMNDKLHKLQENNVQTIGVSHVHHTEQMYDVDSSDVVSVPKRPRIDATTKMLETTFNKEDNKTDRATLPSDWEVQMSVASISKEVGLEKEDVLRTLLAMGLIHRNAENRTLRLVIPPLFVEQQMLRYTTRASNLMYATFNKELLLSTTLKVNRGKKITH